jgi:hypothetical protein
MLFFNVCIINIDASEIFAWFLLLDRSFIVNLRFIRECYLTRHWQNL